MPFRKVLKRLATTPICLKVFWQVSNTGFTNRGAYKKYLSMRLDLMMLLVS